MKRIFHNYKLWEDVKKGMYKHCSEVDSLSKVNDCIDLLTNRGHFYDAMQRLSNDWIHSTENTLSNSNNNRRAWLGRSACCYSFGHPENMTQLAWMKMTPEQREHANQTADMFLIDWEQKYNGQPNLLEVFNA